ncbi:ATP-binding protein [Phaeacidiphilus oryzae]|uniref:ATP-binding protein n=1 Tax=Phaeacidiphilus oryzae TaxID=348818 RepID=UPI0007C8685F|nr:ATP-binding protein [Phaeacidiphilus oryzae]
MSSYTFAPATREQARARIALEGPEGSGKTYTAMVLATVLGAGARFAVIDTERGSASKYARGKSGTGFDFDVAPLHSFDPRELPKVLASAAQAGYPVVVVDSLSHFWMGKGGMLELVDAVGKRQGSGGGFGGWKEARPWERDMIDALLAFPGHVIVTMRTKTEWLIDDSGPKKKITKVGTKAEQREGIGYEFDIIGDLDQENTLVISKSRCPALQGQVINRPGPDVAVSILEWLNDGDAAPDLKDLVEQATALTTFVEARALRDDVERRGLLGGAHMHPATGQPTTLGAYILERGHQLRAAEAQQPAAAAPVEDRPAQAPAAAEEPSAAAEEPPTASPAERGGQPSGPRPATAPQMRKMGALFRELKLTDRAEALEYTAGVIGRQVASRNELTREEAGRLIDHMEKSAASESASV